MNGEDRAQAKDLLQRRLRSLVVMTLFLFLSLAVIGSYAVIVGNKQRHDIARLTVQTHTALCALRNDLSQRVHDAEKFLRQHPNGIPGIPAALIATSIANQQGSVSALDILRCEKIPRRREG